VRQTSDPKRILVIRGGAIGDFILTLPALAALRRRYPEARLELLGHPPVARLAVAGGWIERVHSLEAAVMASCFTAGGRPGPEAAALFAGCDLIVAYLHDPQAIFRSNVTRGAKVFWVAGPHRPAARAKVHATEVFLKPLAQLGIRHADPVPRLVVPAPGADSWPPGPGRWLALHPGSGSERKNWPEGSWAELLARLIAATDLNLLLIGGEAEGHRLARLAEPLPAQRVRLAEHRPLVELAGWLQQCVGYVGHDSGISHLAAAVGLPGLIVWGETNETVWRPRSERMKLIHDRRGLSALSVDRVFGALPLTRTPSVTPPLVARF
jgi:ADP-heptose:LPS heptosyltransferase